MGDGTVVGLSSLLRYPVKWCFLSDRVSCGWESGLGVRLISAPLLFQKAKSWAVGGQFLRDLFRDFSQSFAWRWDFLTLHVCRECNSFHLTVGMFLLKCLYYPPAMGAISLPRYGHNTLASLVFRFLIPFPSL